MDLKTIKMKDVLQSAAILASGPLARGCAQVNDPPTSYDYQNILATSLWGVLDLLSSQGIMISIGGHNDT